MTPLESKLQILLQAVREADPKFAAELEQNYSRADEVGKSEREAE